MVIIVTASPSWAASFRSESVTRAISCKKDSSDLSSRSGSSTYAYILTRANGYPCVFYKDYYNYGLGAQIKTLMQIRKANAYGSAYEYTSVDDADYYAYSRAGDSTHKGLMLVLNDGGSARSRGITSPFKSATLTDKTGNYSGTITTDANGYGNFPVQARSWSVWVPN